MKFEIIVCKGDISPPKMAGRKKSAATTAAGGTMPNWQHMENVAIAWAGIEAGSAKSQSTMAFREDFMQDSFAAKLRKLESSAVGEGVPANFFLTWDGTKKMGSVNWTVEECIKHRTLRSKAMLHPVAPAGGGAPPKSKGYLWDRFHSTITKWVANTALPAWKKVKQKVSGTNAADMQQRLLQQLWEVEQAEARRKKVKKGEAKEPKDNAPPGVAGGAAPPEVATAAEPVRVEAVPAPAPDAPQPELNAGEVFPAEELLHGDVELGDDVDEEDMDEVAEPTPSMPEDYIDKQHFFHTFCTYGPKPLGGVEGICDQPKFSDDGIAEWRAKREVGQVQPSTSRVGARERQAERAAVEQARVPKKHKTVDLTACTGAEGEVTPAQEAHLASKKNSNDAKEKLARSYQQRAFVQQQTNAELSRRRQTKEYETIIALHGKDSEVGQVALQRLTQLVLHDPLQFQSVPTCLPGCLNTTASSTMSEDSTSLCSPTSLTSPAGIATSLDTYHQQNLFPQPDFSQAQLASYSPFMPPPLANYGVQGGWATSPLMVPPPPLPAGYAPCYPVVAQHSNEDVQQLQDDTSL